MIDNSYIICISSNITAGDTIEFDIYLYDKYANPADNHTSLDQLSSTLYNTYSNQSYSTATMIKNINHIGQYQVIYNDIDNATLYSIDNLLNDHDFQSSCLIQVSPANISSSHTIT